MRSHVILCDHRLRNDALSTAQFKFVMPCTQDEEKIGLKDAEGGGKEKEEEQDAEKKNVG